MATSAEAVRSELAIVTAAAAAEIRAAAPDLDTDPLAATYRAIGLIVPTFYDAAGTLSAAWYDEIRSEVAPPSVYVPQIIGDPATEWIEREMEKAREDLVDIEAQMQRLVDEAVALAEKEVARGFRDTTLGNLRQDQDALGWSRVARPGACKFCLMLADKGAVYRSESTAIFAAHTNCNCATRPEFRGGNHGPEADAIQYLASSKRARSQKEQDARNARVRAYLNKNYPDAPG